MNQSYLLHKQVSKMEMISSSLQKTIYSLWKEELFQKLHESDGWIDMIFCTSEEGWKKLQDP